MRDQVVVVARWCVRAGELDRVLEGLEELRRASLAEPGCLAYEVHQVLGEPNRLVLVERYQHAGALDAHVASEHFQEWVVKTIVPLLESRQVERMRPET